MPDQSLKNHLPLVLLSQPGKSLSGGDAHCDYCAADAVWFHWADLYVNRDTTPATPTSAC